MAPPILRRAAERDLEAILEVREATVRSLAPRYYSLREVEDWLAVENACGTAHRVASGLVWVACEGGAVVGYACGVPGQVEALYVLPSHQRRGLGTRLLARAEDPSRRAGAESVEVFSTFSAVSFYEARRYRPVEPCRVKLPSGAAVGAVRMVKRFPRAPLGSPL